MTPEEFKLSWQIELYAIRLEEEKEKGNDDAVRFLRHELFNLKKQQQ